MIVISPIFKPFVFLLRHLLLALEHLGLVVNDNPTKDWARDSSREIVLDLDNNTLCGVGLGETMKRLEFLGSCEDYTRMIVQCDDCDGRAIEMGSNNESLHLNYGSLGLSICCGLDLTIQSFDLWLSELKDESMINLYSGKILFDGKTLSVEDVNSAKKIRGQFGEPDDIQNYDNAEEDEGISCACDGPFPMQYGYEKTTATWLILFDKDDQPSTFMVAPVSETQASTSGSF